MSNEPGLARRLAAGDAAAFDELFDAYADRLVRYVACYVGSEEQAQDVVQDLFFRLWDRRADLASVTNLETYLYISARNRALSQLRQHAVEERWRAARMAEGGADSGEPVPDAAQQLVANETAATLQRAIDRLAPRQRDVMLRYWRGERSVDIAAALGISANAVGVHISRALAHLRKLFRDDQR